MRRIVSKFVALLDRQVDLRNDWPAVIAAASLLVATVIVNLAVLTKGW